MILVDPFQMEPNVEYYIENKKDDCKEKKKGTFLYYLPTPNNSGLIVYFKDIYYINKSIHIHPSISNEGVRHSKWFNFYLPENNIFEKRKNKLYLDATNIKLRDIIGDPYFIW